MIPRAQKIYWGCKNILKSTGKVYAITIFLSLSGICFRNYFCCPIIMSLIRKPFRHGRVIRIAAELMNILGAVGVQREEMIPRPALEHGIGEAWGQRAAEQRVASARLHVTCLPHACRDDELDELSLRWVTAEDDVFAGAIRVKQDQPQRIAAVEMPDFIRGQLVEQRHAARFVAVHADHGRADRSAAFHLLRGAIGTDEQRPFHGQGLEMVMFDQGFDFGVHGTPVYANYSLYVAFKTRRARSVTHLLGCFFAPNSTQVLPA